MRWAILAAYGESLGLVGRGFFIGLTHKRRADSTVAHVLDCYEHISSGAGPLVVTGEQYVKWFGAYVTSVT